MGAGSLRGPRAAPETGVMPHDAIRAVLFDLGDTILNFGRVNTTKAFLAGARASYAFLKQHSRYRGLFFWYFLRNLVRLRAKYVLSNILQRDFDSLEMLRTIGARKGVELSPGQWEQFAWLWYEPLARCAQIEPDLPETLGTLQRMGLKLGIVSNTFVNRASLERHLAELDLLAFFSVQLYSYEFHFRKPSVEIFRLAAERIGAALPSILFVGDRIDNDIEPALQSGMHAVLKAARTNRGQKAPPGAYRIDRLAELPDLVAKLNAEAAHLDSTQG